MKPTSWCHGILFGLFLSIGGLYAAEIPTASPSPTPPFPVEFEVPVEVAKKGVFVGMFGQFVGAQTSGTGPWKYVTTGAASAAVTSTLSTKIAGQDGIPPTATSIPVESVAGFPTSGELLLIQGNLVVRVKYTSVNTGANAFEGVTFLDKVGVAGGFQVTMPNILADTIHVESTANFPTSGVLLLQSPIGAIPNQNFAVQFTGKTPNAFTGVTMFPDGTSLPGGKVLPSGGAVNLLTGPVAGTMTYSDLPASGNLPLVNLFPSPHSLPSSGTVKATLRLPNPSANGILSGVLVIGVGAPTVLPISNAGEVGSPTPGTNPDAIFGIFEWGLTSTTLDFDVSEVDQVGFPFRVTTAASGTRPPPPADPSLGVGMLVNREQLFSKFPTFLNAQDPASNAGVFLQGRADNPDAPFPKFTRLTAPQDIIGTIQGQPPLISFIGPAGSTGTGATAYYQVVAESESGASMGSNVIQGVSTDSQSGLKLQWQSYPYATSYRVYWSNSANQTTIDQQTMFTSLVDPKLIATTHGNASTSYTDTSPGDVAKRASLPTAKVAQSNYHYDPLNAYFTQAVLDFFEFYLPPESNPTENTFVFDDQATSTKWEGYTQDIHMGGHKYRALVITGTEGKWGKQFKGKTLQILQPLFAENMDSSSYPPYPTVLLPPNPPFFYQSPASMIFGGAGVYGNYVTPGSTLAVGDAKDVYNSIVSAFNRGLTPRKGNGGWTNVISPNYWAEQPLLTKAIPHSEKGGKLPPGMYRYTITAVNILGDTSGHETSESNFQEVHVKSGESAVRLEWAAWNMAEDAAPDAGGFNIYRSKQNKDGSWSPPRRVRHVKNQILKDGSPVPRTFFVDLGTGTAGPAPSLLYYRKGSTANFYSAYFSQPDISINGLAYGFPYGDKGGLSTNVQMSVEGVKGLTVVLNPWGNSQAHDELQAASHEEGASEDSSGTEQSDGDSEQSEGSADSGGTEDPSNDGDSSSETPSGDSEISEDNNETAPTNLTAMDLARMAGAYNGILGDLGSLDPSTPQESITFGFESADGAISLWINRRGGFSCVVRMPGAVFRGRGLANSDGTLSAELWSPAKREFVPIQLEWVTTETGADYFRGTFGAEGEWKVLAGSQTYGRTNPMPDPGFHTVQMTIEETNEPGLAGVSPARATITPLGVARIVGSLADGSRIAAAVPIWASTGDPEEALLLLFFDLYRGNGFVAGWVLREEWNGRTNWNGLMDWMAPPQSEGGTAFFPDGFMAELSWLMESYTPPNRGERVLDWEDGQGSWILQGEGIPLSLDTPVTLTLNNQLFLTHPEESDYQARFFLNTREGVFHGWFRNTVDRSPLVRFEGSLNRSSGTGEGFFLHSGGSGDIILEPIFE